MTDPCFPILLSNRRLQQVLGFDRELLCDVANKAGGYYHPFDRRRERGNGKWRHIDNPGGLLKLIQRRILSRMLSKAVLPDSMMGGRPGRSIRDNSLPHLKQSVLVTLDLKACYPRINHQKVFAAYRRLDCSTEIASLLTKLTTFQNRLPQGAPTSPVLANLTLLQMHDEIQQIALKMRLNLSFYVDDIALSGTRAREAIEPVIQIISKHGHSISRKKIRIMSMSVPQCITGLVVNQKPSIQKTKRVVIAQRILELADREEIPDHALRSIRGRIAHVKCINPLQGAHLERLAARLLPSVGVGGSKPRTDEIKRCTDSSKHDR